MSLIIKISIFFLIFVYCYGFITFNTESGITSVRVEIRTSANKPNISDDCNSTIARNENELENCDKSLCKKFNCTNQNSMSKNGNENDCSLMWGSFCCGTKLVNKWCSKKDQNIIKDYINGIANIMEKEKCANRTWKSYNCNGSNNVAAKLFILSILSAITSIYQANCTWNYRILLFIQNFLLRNMTFKEL
jgi:hypothetical protein